MPRFLLVGLLLAAAAPARADGKGLTLWLVQPLYPGQDALVARTEEAIAALVPADQRAGEVIGRKALEGHLSGKKVSLDCIQGLVPCADPLDALVAGLGFDRVVLLRAGQDEAGYTYKVASWRPVARENAASESHNTRLERALLGALVKVVPLASTLKLSSSPAGAVAFVDGEKVGQTPTSLQILPGEHVIKLVLPAHEPLEFTEVIPVRGQLALDKPLKKVPARLVVTAHPPGALISVDGQLPVRDRVDQGIAPGSHTVAFTAEGHEPATETLEIAPGDSANLDKTLLPTSGTRVKSAISAAQEDVFGRKAYFELGFEYAHYNRLSFATKLDSGVLAPAQVTGFATTPAPSIQGFTAEYGATGRYFGVGVVGASFLTSGGGRWPVKLNGGPVDATSTIRSLSLRALQPTLRYVFWRLSASLQGGLELRLTQLDWKHSGDFFGGEVRRAVDVDVSGRAVLRAHFYDGFYGYGSFRVVRAFSGNASTNSFMAGLGYAF